MYMIWTDNDKYFYYLHLRVEGIFWFLGTSGSSSFLNRFHKQKVYFDENSWWQHGIMGDNDC